MSDLNKYVLNLFENMHAARQMHTAELLDSRTLMQALPRTASGTAGHCRMHCPTAANCPTHYHTLPRALLPHTATCTVARIYAQPHTSPQTQSYGEQGKPEVYTDHCTYSALDSLRQ
jgi:hypothetical protein